MTEEDFKKNLNPTQYKVMREKMDEPPYLGLYHNHKEHGVYACAACSNPLFISISKFDAKNGWPSFRSAFKEDAVVLEKNAAGKTEVTCSDCKSHLGYFYDNDSSGKPYFQINSIGLSFIKMPDFKKEEGGKEDEKTEEEAKQKENTAKQAEAAGMGVGAMAAAGATGLVLGASGMWYVAPATMCVAPESAAIVETAELATTPLPAASPSPSGAGGTVRPPTPAPAAITTPTPLPTPSPADASSASSSTGAGSADGTI